MVLAVALRRHFAVCVFLKYLKLGGARSFLAGIRNPSPLTQSFSLPMTMFASPSVQ
jgi:hypothetical protein